MLEGVLDRDLVMALKLGLGRGLKVITTTKK